MCLDGKTKTKTDDKGSKAASSNKRQEVEKSRDRPRHERARYIKKKKFIKPVIMFVCEFKRIHSQLIDINICF